MDAHILCEQINALSQRQPAVEDVDFVVSMLEHKWHGVQVVAGKALSSWQLPQTIPALRTWLLRHEQNGQMQRQIQRVLARCVSADDLLWVLDCYWRNRAAHSLLLIAVLMRFPREAIADQLVADARTGDIESITVLACVPFVRRTELLRMLARTSGVSHRAYIERCIMRAPLTCEQTLLAGWKSI